MQHTIYWIEGDGIGADIWKAAKPVIDAAVECAYHGQEELIWKELQVLPPWVMRQKGSDGCPGMPWA